MSEQAVSRHRTITALALRDSIDKTVRVRIERRVKHKLYGKVITKRRTMLAHDEDNISKSGDRLMLEEYRRMSKRKAWRVSGKVGGDSA